MNVNVLVIGYIVLLVLPHYSCRHCSSAALPDLTYQYANIEFTSSQVKLTTVVRNIAPVDDCVNPKNISAPTKQCISLLYKNPSDTAWQVVGNATIPVKALGAGEVDAAQQTLTLLRPGTYSVMLEIDCERIVAELDESNNKWTK